MVFRARTRDVVAAAAGLGWTNAVTRLLRIAKDRPPFEEIRYRLYPRYMALDFAECSVLVPLGGGAGAEGALDRIRKVRYCERMYGV